jgi:hypothetical protein
MNLRRPLILLGVIAAVMHPATRGAFKIDDACVPADASSQRTRSSGTASSQESLGCACWVSPWRRPSPAMKR